MSITTRMAVVGAGGFARFAVAQFVKRPGLVLAAACDRDPRAVEALRTLAPALQACESLEQLLADPTIDLIYIASPPALHHAQSLQALRAGKHVICEKPAALTAAQARELREEAARQSRLFVVNLMQRYNPLYDAVGQLVRRQLLGEFLHGFFENYASDEFLAPQHWFWNERLSGGIFIEHGVHFFDMFAGWFGEGRVVSAQKFARPGHAGIWDVVQCSVVYCGHAPVNFFHGFNQPKALDRQELRLQFERGEITLHDWVPTRFVLNAVASEAEIEAIHALFPQAQLAILDSFGTLPPMSGRFKPLRADHRIRLDTGQRETKSQVYEDLVRRMLDDQLQWLADPQHVRRVDADNAVDSVAIAEQAEHLAQRLP